MDFAPDEFEMIYSGDGKRPIRRGDIKEMINAEIFVSAWWEWSRYKRFGLPHGRGWRRERPQWIRVIEILDQEFDLYQSEETKRARSR